MPATAFADRIIEYAVANATVTPPDLLVEREIDVMIDELKVRLTQQQIEFEEYLKVTERDEAKLREESREGAEHRVKVLLVLGAVADKEQVRDLRRRRGVRDREDAPLEPRGPAAHRVSRVAPWPLLRPLHPPTFPGHRRASSTPGSRPTRSSPTSGTPRTSRRPPTDQVEAATDALEPLELDEADQALEAELAAAGVGAGDAAMHDHEKDGEA